ncbi:MAG: efflux RND transporter permease subunit, partial [Terracidiphilus sp.]
NTARFFVENRILAWAALVACTVWGVWGYLSMPQRKDPDIPVRVAVVACQWPGATAQQVEQLITRPIEQVIAQNKTIHAPAPDDFGIQSLCLPGASFVTLQLAPDMRDSREQFNDINLKLQVLNGRLPEGASPIQFQSEFGDTAALMLTVASPSADAIEVQMRAQAIAQAIREERALPGRSMPSAVSLVICYPLGASRSGVEKAVAVFERSAERDGVLERADLFSGSGFIGLDGGSRLDDAKIAEYASQYMATRMQPAEINPDVWPLIIVRDPGQVEEKLQAVAGPKYSYAELDHYTDLISRSLLGVSQISRVDRKGVQPQAVYLNYSQERLAAYGLQVSDLSRALNARNITLPGGVMETGTEQVRLDASGKFEDAPSIGDTVVSRSPDGAPVYLRDLVDISRSYQSPATYLNYYVWVDKEGRSHRDRAITLAVFMRSGEQIQKFGVAVDKRLDEVKRLLPPDLRMVRTSDQPLQVKENVDLFMDALYEAIALVVLVALIGFWEWRSALLMALSIPITLTMTFGMAHMVGIDLQQVSIASLIIALGLLVDDPVVANDAIKRDLAAGHPPIIASWLGPTKLARAILYATATNIVAYLPLAMLPGNTGDFLRSLPIVMTAALVSSRLVSMTFIPLLGYYLLQPPKKRESTIEERRTRGYYGFYYRIASAAIQHRWKVLGASLIFLLVGGLVGLSLKSQFFPEDVQYWSYADVWLPNNAPLALTNSTSAQAEQVILRVLHDYERDHPHPSGPLLKGLTSFVGGGGPRFWFSVSPEMQQSNYAQVLIQLSDKDVTPEVVGTMQEALSREIPGAFVVVKQLQSNPVSFPIEVRLFSVSDIDPADEPADIQNLRRLAGQVQDILRAAPGVQTVQNDWFAESPAVRLDISPDRANMAGVTNRDVANSTSAAISGTTVTSLREGNDQIPVVARLIPTQRAQLSDSRGLYVYPASGTQKVPLQSVASIQTELQTERIRRQEHFRMIGVHAWPQPGVLPSQVYGSVKKKLAEFQRTLPPSYRMEIGGEKAKQTTGFFNLSMVLLACLLGIYAALLVQFNNPLKPLLVFAATPYGVVGALLALALMGTPFGFMAFLGITSLVGVIVSHIIVLFDFIEEMHEKGEPFAQAICDAGIERLRPVLITVGATILALFPLASHGGPLWQPLCYAQIGGLAAATFITLLLVPVFYAIAVLDLKIVRWEEKPLQSDAAR